MTKHLDLDAIERAYRMTGNADTVTMRLIAELRMARPVVETAEALLAALDAATERAKKAEEAVTASLACASAEAFLRSIDRNGLANQLEAAARGVQSGLTQAARLGWVPTPGDAAAERARADVAEIALAEMRAIEAPRLARRIELENECARLDAMLIVARVGRKEAEAALLRWASAADDAIAHMHINQRIGLIQSAREAVPAGLAAKHNASVIREVATAIETVGWQQEYCFQDGTRRWFGKWLRALADEKEKGTKVPA